LPAAACIPPQTVRMQRESHLTIDLRCTWTLLGIFTRFREA
jgi:hypothetical protein